MNQENSKFLEIVLIPMSQDVDGMHDFQQLCGCPMIPIEEQYNVDNLKDKFGVFEMPTFIVLDKFGNIITSDGFADIKKLSKSQVMNKWNENNKKEQNL